MNRIARFLLAMLACAPYCWPMADVGAPHLQPPASGPIVVAFVVTGGANVIDFAGLWEVFQDTMAAGAQEMAFRLYTVGDTRNPVTLTGGLKLVPDYTFDDAPVPAVIVVGTRAAGWTTRVSTACAVANRPPIAP